MVEDDVEDDFDAGAVQRLDHVAELVEDVERPARELIRVMRREERDRLVAPVVDAACRRLLRIELEHRQELDGGDAQVLEVRNLFDQARRRCRASPAETPELGWLREAAHVQLVDDRLGERPSAAARRLPSRSAPGSATTLFIALGGVGAGPAPRPAVVGVGNRDGEPVRIEQHLLAVEPQTAFRRERPVGPVAVDLPGLEARHEGMPVVIGAVRVRGRAG